MVTRVSLRRLCLPLFIFVLAGAICTVRPARAQKYGGVLKGLLRETPAHISPLEASTIESVAPAVPAYNNLVNFDPLKAQESLSTIIPELAARWTWSDGGKRLTFTLHRGVTWHDGKPFKSADVKYTYDQLRGAGPAKLSLNHRRECFWNVKDILTGGDYQVSFLLGAPEPSLLALLASQLVPVVPSHIDPNELRLKPIGTGPFRVKEIVPEQRVVLEKNPSYWVKGRPYLDGIEYNVIRARPSRIAALSLGQADFSLPLDVSVSALETLRGAIPNARVQEQGTNTVDNVLVNAKRPPFDNLKVRQAMTLAMDRHAFVVSTYQGGAQEGGVMVPPPYGVWGLSPSELAALPGFGDPAKDREQARKLMAEAGFGQDKPLKVTVSTRALDNYLDAAAWIISQLKEIYFDPTLDQVETAMWFPKMARRDFQLAVNVTAALVDDPDANFFENYSCGSERNYSDYCNEEVQKLLYAQSSERNSERRLRLVKQIDGKLQADVARVILAHRVERLVTWPYVHNLIQHQSLYNHWRMQDVWLDK
jgi:peptide/nickel transport system substrate-binding protein